MQMDEGIRMIKNRIAVFEPYIKGLPDHAIYLSMINNEEERNKWILNNYVHITCNQNYLQRETLGFDFYIDYNNCPYIIRDDIPYQILAQDKSKLHAQLIELIDAGYAMQVSLNEDKISNRQFTNAGKVSFHNNFLYGYDNGRKIFLLGFFDKDGRFIFGEIGYDLFYDTFCANEFQRFEIIKYQPNYHYLIDLKMMKRQFMEFSKSYNIRELRERYVINHASPYKAFGLDVYIVMADYYKDVLSENIILDIRPTFMLKERIMCMIKRLEYLRDYEQVKAEKSLNTYKAIYSIVNKCHSKILYSYISKSMKQLNVSKDVLRIRELEGEALEEIMDAL